MLVFVFLAVAAGVNDDKDEDQEADSKEHDHAGSVFPYLLNSIGKLGPIHVAGTIHRKFEKINQEFNGLAGVCGK
jgi:hypothetical protein